MLQHFQRLPSSCATRRATNRFPRQRRRYSMRFSTKQSASEHCPSSCHTELATLRNSWTCLQQVAQRPRNSAASSEKPVGGLAVTIAVAGNATIAVSHDRELLWPKWQQLCGQDRLCGTADKLLKYFCRRIALDLLRTHLVFDHSKWSNLTLASLQHIWYATRSNAVVQLLSIATKPHSH